jgi:hypothetical protein
MRFQTPALFTALIVTVLAMDSYNAQVVAQVVTTAAATDSAAVTAQVPANGSISHRGSGRIQVA